MTTVLEVLGALLIVAGVTLISVPAALIVAGSLLLLAAYIAVAYEGDAE